MGTPLGPKYIPYTYMDPLGVKTASLGDASNERTTRRQTLHSPKPNMEPQNGPLEDFSPYVTGPHGFHISFGGGYVAVSTSGYLLEACVSVC